MAEKIGSPQNPVTRMNGSAASLKSRTGESSPRTMVRSPSVERRRNNASRANGDTGGGSDSPLAAGADPLRPELNRLENQLKVKEKELEQNCAETKALRQLSIGKDKAIAALQIELDKLKEKHLASEKLLADKTLELKKAEEQKKGAFSSQAAAEATIRRLQAANKNAPSLSLDAVLAPLEAQLKISQKEVAKLTEDNKAQERLMRAKDTALVKAEQAVIAAKEKAAQVDVLQNLRKNLEKQVEKGQEENKTLDKMYKQKVEELKKVTEQVSHLEEALTQAGSIASTIKEYQAQVLELQAKLKLNQDELARAKVAVNRVAVAVANDFKDDTEKVIPMQQWLEERRFYQGEAQTLREKLALAEKSAKTQSQLKEKYQARLKVIEDGQKMGSNHRDQSRRFSTGGAVPRAALSTGGSTVDPDSQPGSATSSNGAGSEAEFGAQEEVVSGKLYSMLEKEVVSLRKAFHEKDQTLKDKEDAIEMLSKKVELLTKAMETEAKKSRRELSSVEKELAALKVESPSDPKRRVSASTSARISSPSSLSTRKSMPKIG